MISDAPARAMPKSVTRARPSASTRTLWGFRSRWTIPRACANRTPVEDLADDLDRLGRREAALDQVLERGALHVLHRDEVAALVLAAVIDRDDVRVLEAGGGLRLAAEALDELLVGSEALVEELEGDLAPEHLIVGRPDVRHSARADAAHQECTACPILSPASSLIRYSPPARP